MIPPTIHITCPIVKQKSNQLCITLAQLPLPNGGGCGDGSETPEQGW